MVNDSTTRRPMTSRVTSTTTVLDTGKWKITALVSPYLLSHKKAIAKQLRRMRCLTNPKASENSRENIIFLKVQHPMSLPIQRHRFWTIASCETVPFMLPA
jgi:hypothetical protein